MKRNQQLQISHAWRGVSRFVETAGPFRGLPAGDNGLLESSPRTSPATIWLPAMNRHVVLGMRW